MRKFAILALSSACTLMICTPKSSAQRAGGAGSSGARSGASFAHFSRPVPGAGIPRAGSIAGGRLASRADLAAFRRFYRSGPYGDLLSSLGVLSDYAGDSSTYGYASATPNLFLLPAPPSAGMIEDQPQATVRPVMIELRGDRYVRVTNDGKTSASDAASANDLTRPDQLQPLISSRANHAATAPTIAVSTEDAGAPSAPSRASGDLPPAVLIYRDGHTESVRDYAIADGMLYARGDYYSDGYWTKTISLAGLNLPATISSNADRGVKFVLPGAPNEVITRP